MSLSFASRLAEFFEERASGGLRSVVAYGREDFDVVRLRDGVAEQYTPEEFVAAIDDTRLESLAAPIYRDAFADDHGDLTCLVACFERVVELNFVLDDGAGVAVALDETAFDDARGLVSDARSVALAARD